MVIFTQEKHLWAEGVGGSLASILWKQRRRGRWFGVRGWWKCPVVVIGYVERGHTDIYIFIFIYIIFIIYTWYKSSILKYFVIASVFWVQKTNLDFDCTSGTPMAGVERSAFYRCLVIQDHFLWHSYPKGTARWRLNICHMLKMLKMFVRKKTLLLLMLVLGVWLLSFLFYFCYCSCSLFLVVIDDAVLIVLVIAADVVCCSGMMMGLLWPLTMCETDAVGCWW